MKRTPLKRKTGLKRKSRLRKRSKNRIPTLRRKAWGLFSKIKRIEGIDEGGFNSCFTCDIKKHWKGLQAGHFIHCDALDFCEENISPQCPRCNKFLHGNLSEYTIRMIKKYGMENVEELRRQSKIPHRWTVGELEGLIEEFEERLDRLTRKYNLCLK